MNKSRRIWKLNEGLFKDRVFFFFLKSFELCSTNEEAMKVWIEGIAKTVDVTVLMYCNKKWVLLLTIQTNICGLVCHSNFKKAGNFFRFICVLELNCFVAGNSRSATELTCCLILSLARKIASADASMKKGKWSRREFMSEEVSLKKNFTLFRLFT